MHRLCFSILLFTHTAVSTGHLAAQSADPLGDVIRSHAFESLRGEAGAIYEDSAQLDDQLPRESNLHMLFYEDGRATDMLSWLGPRPFRALTYAQRVHERAPQFVYAAQTYNIIGGGHLKLEVALPHPKSLSVLEHGLSPEFDRILGVSGNQSTGKASVVVNSISAELYQLANGGCKLITLVKPEARVMVSMTPCENRDLLNNFFGNLNFTRLEVKLNS